MSPRPGAERPSSDPPGPATPSRSPVADLARFAGMGLQLAASMGLLAFGGYWLDRWLGTLPLFLVVGAFAGLLGGTVSIVKRVSRWRGSSASDPHRTR